MPCMLKCIDRCIYYFVTRVIIAVISLLSQTPAAVVAPESDAAAVALSSLSLDIFPIHFGSLTSEPLSSF